MGHRVAPLCAIILFDVFRSFLAASCHGARINVCARSKTVVIG